MADAFDKPSILIVEDELLLAETLKTALTGTGMFRAISTEVTRDAAAQAILRLRPDLILLDLGLPDGDGLPLIEFAAGRSPESKVIVLTGSATDDDLADAMRAGARGYISKSLGFGELLTQIRRVIAGEVAVPASMTGRLIRALTNPARPAPSPIDLLSDRERTVLESLANGHTNSEIADELGIATNTVRNHVQRILSKLDVSNRVQAAALLAREQERMSGSHARALGPNDR